MLKGGLNLTDEDILSLIKKKNDLGLSMMAEKYEKLLVYIVAGILGSRSRDIEECVNDTYLKFWRNVDSYDLEKASLITYLKVIARNTALNRLRDTKRHEDRTHGEDISEIAGIYADQSQNIENQVVRKEDMAWMNQMIASLAERDRELMIRKYFYLQSSKVIAKSMGMTVTAVDSKLSRLRTKFKLEFSEWEKEERR
ncbi:MAG: sigma-70 family RNA polymerase sigma factor [Lachnospiraceae bacterium]|nr:sigma-70 family RNA polymerase sigma factor [Lachnospiraceae bacterium]